MKTFFVYINTLGDWVASKTKRNERTEGLAFVGEVRSSMGNQAVKMAKARVESGLFTLPAVAARPRPASLLDTLDKHRSISKVIFCDFNGVLDNGTPHSDSDIHHKLSKEACPDKVFMLLTLALKHQAPVVMTSLHRARARNYRNVFELALLNSANPEHAEFYRANQEKLRLLTHTYPTPNIGSRRKEIIMSIADEGYSHYVVFEDDHDIGSDLNEVRTKSFTGITREHIEKADALLMQDMR